MFCVSVFKVNVYRRDHAFAWDENIELNINIVLRTPTYFAHHWPVRWSAPSAGSAFETQGQEGTFHWMQHQKCTWEIAAPHLHAYVAYRKDRHCIPGMEISTRHQPNAGGFVSWRVNSLHLPATVAGK